MNSRSVKVVVSLTANTLIALATLLTIRLIVAFFGGLTGYAMLRAYQQWTSYLVVPFGIDGVRTPYGGTFLANTALMIGAVLVVEWGVSRLRKR